MSTLHVKRLKDAVDVPSHRQGEGKVWSISGNVLPTHTGGSVTYHTVGITLKQLGYVGMSDTLDPLKPPFS